MEKIVLLCGICFLIGCIGGITVMSIVITSKACDIDNVDSFVEKDHNEKKYDPCNGCFGAAMGDCDHCPVKGGDSE